MEENKRMPDWLEEPPDKPKPMMHRALPWGRWTNAVEKEQCQQWPLQSPSHRQALFEDLHKIYPNYSTEINANASPNQLSHKVTYLCPDSWAMVKARPSPVSSLMVQLRYLLHIPLMGANPVEIPVSNVSPQGTHTGTSSLLMSSKCSVQF